jgi:hypothetical protein
MKRFSIMLAILLVLLLTSCSNDGTTASQGTTTIESSSQTSQTTEISHKQRLPTPAGGGYNNRFVERYILERLTANSDIGLIPCFEENELLYESEGFRLGSDAGRRAAFSFRTDLFEKIVQTYQNPLVRKIGDYIYLVYDTNKSTRLYVFFSLTKTNAMFTDGFPIVMKKVLSYNDFADIHLGSSSLDVAEIDPIITLYTRIFDGWPSEQIVRIEAMGLYLDTIHLLSDGILKITYRRDGRIYYITSMTFNDDFTLDGFYGATTYKIIDKDYMN